MQMQGADARAADRIGPTRTACWPFFPPSSPLLLLSSSPLSVSALCRIFGFFPYLYSDEYCSECFSGRLRPLKTLGRLASVSAGEPGSVVRRMLLGSQLR